MSHNQEPKSSDTEPKLDTCVICLQPVSERAIAVPCDHCSFDFICLVSWLQEHSKCPLCKADLTCVQYDFRSPDDFKTFNLPLPPSSLLSDTPQQNTRSPTSSPHHRRQNHRSLRRAPRASPFPVSSPATSTAGISRRRHVYRHGLYSLHVGSNRVSRFRDFTPQFFARDAELQNRARKWIRRELQVFDFLSPDEASSCSSTGGHGFRRAERRANNAEFLLAYIMSILESVDIKDSAGRAQVMLGEFLGAENARLFLHELNAWLRSPFGALEDWDRNVQYREKLPTFLEDNSRDLGWERNHQDEGRYRRREEAKRRYQPD